VKRDQQGCAVLGGSRFSAPYRRAFDSVTQSLPELDLELLVDAGVVAGAAGVGADELLESPLGDGVEAAAELDEELSVDPAFEDEPEPPRLSVL